MTQTWKIENGDVALDTHGRVAQIGGSLKVVQDLKTWLLNDIGYNRFAPNMGSDLDDYVGQNVTPSLLNDIRSQVRDVLQDYMQNQMDDIKKRIEERGDPFMAIGLAEPSSLVKTWTHLSVEEIPGAIQINISFLTFTDDVEDVVLVLDSGIEESRRMV